jgi:carotene biosynthesis associated membrane protein
MSMGYVTLRQRWDRGSTGMKVVWALFIAHLAALIFGLLGILVALPNPHLWADSRWGADAFSFGMTYGGSLHIILGAAAMLAFGGVVLGWRKTLIFFVVTVVLSLASELIGTRTGFPFGNYEYTSGLGYKVLGRVPFTIPLSWFYVGFASYLLANIIGARWSGLKQAAFAVLGGAYLLTVWDLVLDPAMAHESLAIQFWVWFETGPYFGMPLKNFVGWTLTAVLFMGVSRALWRSDVNPRRYSAHLPFAIYVVNMFFAMALSLSVGLWGPVVIAIVMGLIPAALAWRAEPPAADAMATRPGGRTAPAPVEAVGGRVMAVGARGIAGRKLDLAVEGAEHLPAHGPVLIAARHYHHLYDGCALIATAPRPLRILVGLDWVKSGATRRLMELACGMVRWPVVLREDGLTARGGARVYRPEEYRRYLHRALRESVALLRAGEALVVFPEAYPTIDPHWTPKAEQGEDAFLPFRPGFIRLVELAQRDGVTRVPIIPVGFAYAPLGKDRWRVTLRLGAPLLLEPSTDHALLAQTVEAQVHALSQAGLPVSTALPQAQLSTQAQIQAQAQTQTQEAISS